MIKSLSTKVVNRFHNVFAQESLNKARSRWGTGCDVAAVASQKGVICPFSRGLTDRNSDRMSKSIAPQTVLKKRVFPEMTV